MIREFQKYYQNVMGLNNLLEAIKHYDFSNYLETVSTIAQIKRRFHVEATRTVYSNGSSGDSTGEYGFGLFFEFWRPSIEFILRDYHAQIRLTHCSRDTENSYFMCPVVFKTQPDANNWSVFLDLSHRKNRIQLREFLKIISHECGCKVSLTAKPNTWLLLGTDPAVQEDFESYLPYLKSLINEDWEPWLHSSVKKKFVFNNQMIDWFTGVNFYTCSFGTKHFLPIFFVNGTTSTNLLNQSIDESRMSDQWEIAGERQFCECGKYYIPFRFTSHARNYLPIDRRLIEGLQSGYNNLQFLRQGDHTSVLYACSTPFYDREYIASILYGKNFSFHADSHFYIGRKKYNFWQDNRPIDFLPFSIAKEETVCLL